MAFFCLLRNTIGAYKRGVFLLLKNKPAFDNNNLFDKAIFSSQRYQCVARKSLLNIDICIFIGITKGLTALVRSSHGSDDK